MPARTRPTACPSAQVLEIRPGEGGADAAAFASELVDTICAHLRRAGIAFDVAATDRTTTVTAAAFGELTSLAGTHRIQRIPRNDPRGRRHTSTATVAVLDAADDVIVDLRDADVDIEAFSGSGAGGQYRNRHALCVRVRHRPSGKVAVSTAHRSLPANIAAAKATLVAELTADLAGAARAERNARRRDQVSTDRSAKTWTWNTQRGIVTDHTTGARWRLRDLQRGRFVAA